MDLATILTGGAAGRPDSISGMQPEFVQALQAMMAAAPPNIASQFRINSGYRSPEVQAVLWKNALAKYGTEAAARKWVAPPGRSNHGHGTAADLQFLDGAAREWAHANAAKYGLGFPMGHEPWHIELAGARKAGLAPGVTAVNNSSPSAAMQATSDSPEQVVAPNPNAPQMASAMPSFLDLLSSAITANKPDIQPAQPTAADLMAEMARAAMLAPPPQQEAPYNVARPVPNDPLARGMNPSRYMV